MIFTQKFFSTKSTNLKNNWNLDLNEHRKVKQIKKSQNFKTLRLNPRMYKGGGGGGEGSWLVILFSWLFLFLIKSKKVAKMATMFGDITDVQQRHHP